MIRKLFLLILFLLSTVSLIRSQDIYDCANSFKYAGHLLETKKYKLASEEFERLVYVCDTTDYVKHLLMRSYILDGQFEKVLSRTGTLFQNNFTVPREIALDYSYALILSNKFQLSEEYISSVVNLHPTDKLFLTMNSQLLNNNWTKAATTFKEMDITDKPYKMIFNEIDNARYKSYPLAIGLSAIIPGTGKVYTGDWKDGIISFIFVTGFTIQAIRGYNTYGSKSGHFIGYTSLAGAFYLGNLYGTYRSVKKHNDTTKQSIYNRIRSTFISSY